MSATKSLLLVIAFLIAFRTIQALNRGRVEWYGGAHFSADRDVEPKTYWFFVATQVALFGLLIWIVTWSDHANRDIHDPSMTVRPLVRIVCVLICLVAATFNLVAEISRPGAVDTPFEVTSGELIAGAVVGGRLGVSVDPGGTTTIRLGVGAVAGASSIINKPVSIEVQKEVE